MFLGLEVQERKSLNNDSQHEDVYLVLPRKTINPTPVLSRPASYQRGALSPKDDPEEPQRTKAGTARLGGTGILWWC